MFFFKSKAMKVISTKFAPRVLSLLCVLLLFAPLLPAQQRRRRQRARRPQRTVTASPTQSQTASPSPKPTPAAAGAQQTPAAPGSTGKPAAAPTVEATAADFEVTFDTLLGSESYALYGELRAVGQQMREGGVNELLQPVWATMGSARETKELTALNNFLKAQTETLANSRVMFATMPGDSSLPESLVAVELPSVEAARKFVPELRSFVASVAPTPAPETQGGAAAQGKRSRLTQRERVEPASAKQKLPFYIKRANNLVAVSGEQFELTKLRGQSALPLSTNHNFRTARARFASEAVFVYFDLGVVEKNTQRMRERYEAERKKQEATAREPGQLTTAEVDPMLMPPDTRAVRIGDTIVTASEAPPPPSLPVPVAEPAEEESSEVEMSASDVAQGREPTPEELAAVRDGQPMPNEADMGPREDPAGFDPMSFLMPLIFAAGSGGAGAAQWPEAVGAGVGLDADAVSIRVLLLNGGAGKLVGVVPFLPVLIPGAPLSPEAAAVMPAEADIYASASLDLTKIYDMMMGGVRSESERQEQQEREAIENEKDADAKARSLASLEQRKTNSPDAQLAAFEKLLNFKIKEDLIGSLGNEVAFSVPVGLFDVRPPQTPGDEAPKERAAPLGPVVLVSVRDRDKLEKLLPRLLALLSLGSSGARANEKHNGVEIMNFGGQGAFAFVGNFLALSTEAEPVRRVIEAHVSGQTLGASQEFRAATAWQPRPALGQVYVSRALLKTFFARGRAETERYADDEMKKFLARFNFDPDAITLSVTDEGDGPLHELRLPRTTISLLTAYMTVEGKSAPVRSNETNALNALRVFHEMQTSYKEERKSAVYATLDELVTARQYPREILEQVDGYRIEFSVSGNRYEATATPTAYPEKGRRSFFMDETGVVRGGDKAGQRAGAADEVVN